MSKVAMCCYSCDECFDESPPVSTWAEARREAKRAGWQFRRAIGSEWHYCPKHRKDI